MVLGRHKRAIGAFPNRRDAEVALGELRDSNFPMDKVSVIARDSDREDDIAGTEVREHVGNKADEGATTGAVAGGALGGLTGLLVGLGTLAIPGIGPIMLAGATATAIATTVAGGAIGAAAGSLVGALIGLGIPEERARVYSDRVARGDYLVIVEGTDEEIRRAQAILSNRGIEDWDVYEIREERDHVVGTDVAHRADVYATPDVSHRPLARNKFAIGVFGGRGEAEQALSELRNTGFSMDQVSIIASDASQNNQLVGVPVRSRVDNYAGFGVVDERAKIYHDRLSQGHYLVIVNGTDEEIRQASTILNRRGIQQFDIYDSSQIAMPSSTSRVASDRDPNVIIVDHQDKIGRNF